MASVSVSKKPTVQLNVFMSAPCPVNYHVSCTQWQGISLLPDAVNDIVQGGITIKETAMLTI